MRGVTVISTANSQGAPHRELECGCVQVFIRGDIVTSKSEAWHTLRPCARHKP